SLAGSAMDPRPLVSVDELWAWQPPSRSLCETLAMNVATPVEEEEVGDDGCLPPRPTAVPHIHALRPGPPTPHHHPQLLVCHDYKGDFPECERWDGCDPKECAPFLYTHWWHIDVFCYFGHKLVTIPPPSYTSIAHRHGVRVLGTVIFEHDAGKEALSSMIATEDSRLRTINALCQIMRTWNFDGFLFNVEVEIEVREAPVLINFLEQLKAALHLDNHNAKLIWYDAVCTDGKLEWQNTINDRNRAFYYACDGIFLNYGWRMTDLENCRFNSGPDTVFVGIDVYGRSGGKAGWNCQEPMTKILRKNLSVALFAPGWAVEENPDVDTTPAADRGSPECNSFRFWSGLSEVMDSRAIDFLPITTTFKNGYSQDGKWFRLRDMDIMPHLALTKKELIPTEHGLLIKNPGIHVIFRVQLESVPDLRVKIRSEGGGSVKILLNRREMDLDRLEDDNTMVFKPSRSDIFKIRGIFVATTEPDTLLTYFEAYEVEVEKCLD
ncbi:hypothetical protein PFISCL1PPCAC_11975, partial [Pristionchus fissidentatus]